MKFQPIFFACIFYTASIQTEQSKQLSQQHPSVQINIQAPNKSGSLQDSAQETRQKSEPITKIDSTITQESKKASDNSSDDTIKNAAIYASAFLCPGCVIAYHLFTRK